MHGDSEKEDANNSGKLGGNSVSEKRSEQDETRSSDEVRMLQLKQRKTKFKSAFTRIRRTFITNLSDNTSGAEFKDLEEAQDNALQVMLELQDRYLSNGDLEKADKINDEIDQMEGDYRNVVDKYEKLTLHVHDAASDIRRPANQNAGTRSVELQEHVDASPANDLQAAPQHGIVQTPLPQDMQTAPLEVDSMSMDNANAVHLGQDMWRQLKRVAIPVFSGDKKEYANWRAAFLACIDQAPATGEYKLLQLRQYLSGEALLSIQSLGHSATAYEIAKERLDRKYGGSRRQVAICFDEIENFKPTREGQPKDIERFADLLDVAVINLKEAGREQELQDGSLYNKLQRKLHQRLLTNYHRWVFEKNKNESVESLREFIMREAEFQVIANETIHGVNNEVRLQSRAPRTFFAAGDRANNRKCPVCQESHGVWGCTQFQRMPMDQRWAIAKDHRLCYRCLIPYHRGQDCNRSRICGVNGCQQTHHRLLHEDSAIAGEGGNDDSGDTHNAPSTIAGYTTIARERTRRSGYLALRTVPVIVQHGDRKIQVNALLDDASTTTYINQDIAAELGVFGEPQQISVKVLNNRTETFNTNKVEFTIRSMNGAIIRQAQACTTGKVTGDMTVIDWNKHKNRWQHLQGIRFPTVGRRPIIDILIGSDLPELHTSLKDICGKIGEPIARLTPLGWTCLGDPSPNNTMNNVTNFSHHTFFVQDWVSQRCDNMIRKFWEIENIETNNEQLILSQPDKISMNVAAQTVSFNDERYKIGIPWKGAIELEDNYEMAKQPLINIEKRLLRQPEVGKLYDQTIDMYEKKGYVRKVTKIESQPNRHWYLPHFPIVRPEKETTKVRIVFDASAKMNNVSLNDNIYQGPKLQQDLFTVLLRFRKNAVALVCDVAEMYLQIELVDGDKPFHRFLWRGLQTNKEPEVYEFNRLVFGVNCSPFLAQYISKLHAKNNIAKYPRAAEAVMKSTYMDDSMDSVSSVEAGKLLYRQLMNLWKGAGMTARKWLSNSADVMEEIPESERAMKINIDNDPLPTVKTLGVMWDANTDEFSFNTSELDRSPLTKRQFLSKISSIFDPLGFLAPYIVRAKIILQDVWAAGCEWDEKLPAELENRAQQWFEELEKLQIVKVPRCLQPHDPRNVKSSRLHIFTDASKDAYAAVIYLVSCSGDGNITRRFIAAKTKVAPLMTVSIPRLELMGAVLGLSLAKTVALAINLPLQDSVFWCDSQNVLYWIRGRSRKFKPFVAHRVGEIQQFTDPQQWRHVPSKSNPADLASRGTNVTNLKDSRLWWMGPDYLSCAIEDWPKTKIEEMSDDAECLKSTNNPVFTLFSRETRPSGILNPENYSSWNRLVRVCSWVLRFVRNCQVSHEQRLQGQLKPYEIANFPLEYKLLMNGKNVSNQSRIIQLNPKLDEDGLLRADSRLVNATMLPFDTRYPVILPRKCPVTKLIIMDHHEKGLHITGTNQTLAALSARYWVIAAREAIREVERDCHKCMRRKAKVANQIMAPLPVARTGSSMRAFAQCAVDYGGPFITIQGRGKRREKRYLCLFTCLETRAVHLELSVGLDTDAFLNAFYRFVNRRGLPIRMHSDNGTNFVGANSELKELVGLIDKERLEDSTRVSHGTSIHQRLLTLGEHMKL